MINSEPNKPPNNAKYIAMLNVLFNSSINYFPESNYTYLFLVINALPANAQESERIEYVKIPVENGGYAATNSPKTMNQTNADSNILKPDMTLLRGELYTEAASCSIATNNINPASACGWIFEKFSYRSIVKKSWSPINNVNENPSIIRELTTSNTLVAVPNNQFCTLDGKNLKSRIKQINDIILLNLMIIFTPIFII